MSSEDVARAEFEAAYVAYLQEKLGGPFPKGIRDEYLERGSDGEYRSYQARGAWWAWRASRAAVIIELPKRADTGVDTGGWPIDSGSHRINSVLAQCAKAIKAAGLRVSQP